MLFLSENVDIALLTNTLVYTFGIAGIVLPVLLFVLMVVFVVKKVGPNPFFGFRTRFALSSPERWNWCNGQLAKFTFLFEPFFLVVHIIVFSLTLVYSWPFFGVILTMIFGVLWMLPVCISIQVVGKKKFKD